MRQLLFTTAVMTFALQVAASAARADCVDYSEARAKQAGAALARNPPAAAKLGLPTLDGLVLDANKTSGDPKCDGPTPKRYFYTTTRSMAEVIGALYPNIRRRTEEDGMGRVWFRNPLGSDRLFLTSGTELHIQRNSDQSIWQIMVDPPETLTPLTPEQQPYSVSDIVEGSPWPGGAKGNRQFVRADGATAGDAAAASPAAAAPAQTAQKSGACKPAGAGGASADGTQAGSAAGAEVGGQAIGGGYGRSVGSAAGALLGGLMGGRKKQEPSQQQPAADPNCP
ncbi:MAG: hypothetical protein OEV90_08275 [Gammaproteobacteria bacterium]|nr:hypothetical protein [Gammaproteobacteria bacterium]MDH4311533.1 hypothetical protein [Gammaproteobacteria bacterium]